MPNHFKGNNMHESNSPRIKVIRLIKCHKCDIDTGLRECEMAGVRVDYCFTCYLREEREELGEFVPETSEVFPW